jgi:outer membrane lipoprotein-sorting protein
LAGLLSGCGEQVATKPPPSGSPGEQLLAEVAERYANLESFSEHTRITKTLSDAAGEETSSSRTELHFRKPNQIFYRLTGDRSAVIACDGNSLIVQSSEEGGYVEQDPPENLADLIQHQAIDTIGVNELILLAGGDPADQLSDVSLEEDDSLNGKPMHVLKGTVREIAEQEDEEVTVAEQRIWVGVEDGLIHKFVLDIARGGRKLYFEEVMDNLAANPTLSDDLFTYQPPKGTRNILAE